LDGGGNSSDAATPPPSNATTTTSEANVEISTFRPTCVSALGTVSVSSRQV